MSAPTDNKYYRNYNCNIKTPYCKAKEIVCDKASFANFTCDNLVVTGTTVLDSTTTLSGRILQASSASIPSNSILNDTTFSNIDATGNINAIGTVYGTNITTDETNIATNTTNIATNTTNIATNTSNIATNTSNIATNTSNIATNTSNIATNTTNITALQTKTQNQSATSLSTTFANDLNSYNQTISNTTARSSGDLTTFRILTPNTTVTGTTGMVIGNSDATDKVAFIQYNPNSFTTPSLNFGIKGYNPYLTIRNPGYVGINTTNPSYYLDVNGVTRLNDNVQVNGSLTSTGLVQGNSVSSATTISAIGNISSSSGTVSGTNITTMTSNIATNTANIATNTSAIATNTTNITSLQTKTQNQTANSYSTTFANDLNAYNLSVSNTTSTSTGTVQIVRFLTPNVTGTGTTQMVFGNSDLTDKAAFITYIPNSFSTPQLNLGIKGYNPYMTIRNPGYVGINNTNPAYYLDVNGNSFFNDNMQVSGSMVATGLVQGDSLSSATTINAIGNISSTSGAITGYGMGSYGNIVATGNVSGVNITGSGTVTGATLTGTISTASQPNITSLGTLTGLASNGTVTFASTVRVGASTLWASASTTRVGVNTITPAEAFDVVGNIKSSGSVSSATLATTGNATVGGTLTVTGALTAGAISYSSISSSGNITQTGGSTTLLDTTTNNLTISGTNKIQFPSNLQQKIGLYSTSYGLGVSSNQLNYIAGTTAAHVFYSGGSNADGTEVCRIANNGNVTATGSMLCDATIETAPNVALFNLSAATQSFTTGTAARVIWSTTANFSSGSLINSSTGIFPSATGAISNNGSTTRYLHISYSIQWAANSTNSRVSYITNTTNSNTTGYSSIGAAGGTGAPPTGNTGSAHIVLAAGQSAFVQGLQYSGGNLNATQAGTWLSIHVY